MEIKQLKDCRWEIPSFTIEDGRVLTDSTMRIMYVNYDVINRSANIGCEFKENTFPIIREFPYVLEEDRQEEISAENVQLFIEQVFPNAIPLEDDEDNEED